MGNLKFNGIVKGKEISGEIIQNNLRGNFRMRQIIKVSPQTLSDYEGTYKLKNCNLIRISKNGCYYGTEPTFLDYDSLRFGTLFPISETTFVSRRKFSNSFFPPNVQISFVRDRRNKIVSLIYKKGNSSPYLAKKLNFKEEELFFYSKDVKIACTITLPLKKALFPAIYLVNSSGSETREFGIWRTFFAAEGFAVFACDKRGVGGSTGDWKTIGFDEAAADVLNGIEMLKSRKDIDLSKIGLWTISQGGWVVPIVASKSKVIKIIILTVHLPQPLNRIDENLILI